MASAAARSRSAIFASRRRRRQLAVERGEAPERRRDASLGDGRERSVERRRDTKRGATSRRRMIRTPTASAEAM